VKPIPLLTVEQQAEFWAHVRRTLTGCWEWTGYCDNYGYGKFYIEGKPFTAHRIAHHLKRGSVADSHVLHMCDNPPCVRPSHLFLGTKKDNSQDMMAKGRGRSQFVPGMAPIGVAALNTVKTHCKRGHEFTPENTHINTKGSRVCKACRRFNYHQRRRVAA
jgi:hypothetical protein